MTKQEFVKHLHGSKLLDNQISTSKNGIRLSLKLLTEFAGKQFCRIFYDDENSDILELVPTDDGSMGRAMKISSGSAYIDFKKASELKQGVYVAKIRGDRIIAKHEETPTAK